MFRRLLNRLYRGSGPTAAGVNLVQEDSPALLSPPKNIGIDEAPRSTAWTVSRLDRIIRRANANPGDTQCLLEARHARHCLSKFWLQAPIDQLEQLYGGPIGQAYRLLLRGPLSIQPLAGDEKSWKQGLTQQLEANFDTPERLNLLLAVMTYCAPGKMQLSDPAESLPRWLLGDYVACFAPELAADLGLPIGLLDQPGPPLSGASNPISPPTAQAPSVDPVAKPEAAALPRLIEASGAEAFNQFQDEGFVNRMVGLINLYVIERSDSDVQLELRRLRRLIGQIWLDVTPASLQAIDQTSLGMIYRALLASNFGAEPLLPDDRLVCEQLTAAAIDMEHPAMAQALLAVMPFLPQGKMRLGPGQNRLPLWLRESFNSLAGVGG